jgi:hypothetical protein
VVALMEPDARLLYRGRLPTKRAVKLLYLLQAFPQGLWGRQIVQSCRKQQGARHAVNLLGHARDNGYVERATVPEAVHYRHDRRRRRFYRLTPAGERWADVLRTLTARRFPQCVPNPPTQLGQVLEDGEVPVHHPFTEEVTPQALAQAEAQALRVGQFDCQRFECQGNGELRYCGAALGEEAVLGVGLGLAVQRLRVRAGLTQAQLSRRTSLRVAYLVRLESGECLPSASKCVRFAEALCTSAAALLALASQIIESELSVKR